MRVFFLVLFIIFLNNTLIAQETISSSSVATFTTAGERDLYIDENNVLYLGLRNGGLRIIGTGTISNVSGTNPIVVANGTTNPAISITRNNIVSGTSLATATTPLALDAGATNAVVGGANATLTINNTAPLWNANQLQGRSLATTTPTNGQVLRFNGTNWAPATEAAATNWLLTGNSNAVYNTNFFGTTNDVPITIRSNNTPMFEVGRRQTLNLFDNSNTGIFPYNDANASVSYVRGTGGNSALQFEASGASFYKPIFFTDSNGNFKMRGSAAGTDFFEMGSAGASNNGNLDFVIGDDGDEPMTFRNQQWNRTPVFVEMLRLQGIAGSTNVRTGVNVNGATPNSTFQVVGSIAKSIVSTTASITLGENNYTVIVSGNPTITLPAAGTCAGRIYIIKKIGAGTSTISSFVNSIGSTPQTNSINNGVFQLQSDGTNWQQIN